MPSLTCRKLPRNENLPEGIAICWMLPPKSKKHRQKEKPRACAGASSGWKEEMLRGTNPLDSPTIAKSVRRAIQKRLKRAAIAFSYRLHVAAYVDGRVH